MSFNCARITSVDHDFAAALRGDRLMLIDGALGTMLHARGLGTHNEQPPLLNLSHPDELTAIHRAYLNAGAEIITANTFGADRLKLGSTAAVNEVYAAAAANARRAGAPRLAADLGPTGKLLEPLGSLGFDDAYELYAEQVRAAVRYGYDLIIIETQTDLLEAKAAVLAAKTLSDLPIFVTLSFEDTGRSFLGTPPEVAAITFSALDVQGIGINCSLGPDQMLPLAEAMTPHLRCPLVIQPNAGLPELREGNTVYPLTADAFACAVEPLLDAGASFIGGCCGTTPAFTTALAELIEQRGRRVRTPRKLQAFTVASTREAVVLPWSEHHLAVIGERINPTGKKRLKAALLKGEMDYVISEALAQEEAGADLLDVNVGIPGLDEAAVLRSLVPAIQSVCALPLQLDSSDPEALESAARIYGGKPLLNSVNGKDESLEAVLPLARRYGCAVLGLTLDERGIPATAEERFAIARKIVARGEALGIRREDMAIDCLVMAAATNQRELEEILKTIRRVKQELGVRCVLGVSNVSFGMPQRNLVNASFLAAAYGAGLDLPILNPLARRYQDTVAVLKLLSGQDQGARHFIESYGTTPDIYDLAFENHATASTREGSPSSAAATPSSGNTPCENAASTDNEAVGEDTLQLACENAASTHNLPFELIDELEGSRLSIGELVDFILTGRKEATAARISELLELHPPLHLINEVLVPTLDEVGRRYDGGHFFLPQLMAAAEAAKAGFDVIRTRSEADSRGRDRAEQQRAERRVVVATVQGDIHDIGKNIVRMLLENYGFTVIDLGFDVAPEDIVEAARRHQAPLVGLSALMTTTVTAMERSITLIHNLLPDTKVIVGGAVLSPEYATTIGADYYGKDAADTARIATRFFEERERGA